MEQMLLKLTLETGRSGTANLLTTQQVLNVSETLKSCEKVKGLERPAAKVRKTF